LKILSRRLLSLSAGKKDPQTHYFPLFNFQRTVLKQTDRAQNLPSQKSFSNQQAEGRYFAERNFFLHQFLSVCQAPN
jgi:hypothetical protein